MSTDLGIGRGEWTFSGICPCFLFQTSLLFTQHWPVDEKGCSFRELWAWPVVTGPWKFSMGCLIRHIRTSLTSEEKTLGQVLDMVGTQTKRIEYGNHFWHIILISSHWPISLVLCINTQNFQTDLELGKGRNYIFIQNYKIKFENQSERKRQYKLSSHIIVALKKMHI